MERNAIYFPYMSVPRNRWFTQLLLYWDQVHSIIPRRYADQPSSLNSYMESLIDAKLVNPLRPGKYIHRIPRFTETFLEYIDALKRPPKYPHLIEKIDTYELHVEKMGDVVEGLCERSLARRIDYDWYEVERSTADQFMLYLARRLGELPEIRSDPVTDEPINLNSFDPRLQNLQSPNINEIRSNVLENLLPMPRQFIDPIEICEFKHDNKLELSRFRNNIESFVVGSAANGDSEIRASNFILENQDIIEELTNSMKSRGWKNISYGDIICYAGLISGIIGGLKTNNAYGAIASAAGLFGATIKFVQDNTNNKKFLKGNPMAYAVLAKEELPSLARKSSFRYLNPP